MHESKFIFLLGNSNGNLSLVQSYTVLHMFRQVLFRAENQSNHQNFEKSLLFYKLGLVFMEMKQKKKFFLKKKFKMADSKKSSFSNSANSQYFFVKISWIGPLASRID